MSPLRQRMIHVLELHRRSPHTIKPYVATIAQLAQFFQRSPDQISTDEIHDFLHHLITVRKLSSSTCNQRIAAIKFFYRHVLGQADFQLNVPIQPSGRLPEPLSRNEVTRLINAANNLKHRVLMMAAYGGGLRAGELVQLKPADIHSDRMLIRVNQGKGKKDRYTLLSPRLLSELRTYWLAYHPVNWLFTNRRNDGPLPTGTAQGTFDDLKKRAGITHGHGIHSLRHSFATHLMEAGVPLPTIQRLMGHTTLATTAKYLHVTSKHVEGVHSPLDLLRITDQERL